MLCPPPIAYYASPSPSLLCFPLPWLITLALTYINPYRQRIETLIGKRRLATLTYNVSKLGLPFYCYKKRAETCGD
jgi:hypothetical protein